LPEENKKESFLGKLTCKSRFKGMMAPPLTQTQGYSESEASLKPNIIVDEGVIHRIINKVY
jgi:hypothetical protein